MHLRAKIDKILEVFLVILTSALVLDVVWQVASRYLLSNPSSFTDELAVFLLIWVGMAGAAYVKGKNEHLAIDILPDKLQPKNKNKLLVFINFMIIIFSLSIMVIGGVWLVYTRFQMGQVSSALQVPLGFVYSIVPISGLLMIYYSIDDIRNLINANKKIKR
ncbi:TRAP transporter small permease [Marinilabilia salmonicolor]|jgi:TRAP-type C4-dicarboxylate transport system permease small subunit|uniref:TRAP-type C4-dicarboxylate transport system permease small subunit n=1 Tax=Marinilabilia salmonicolor TaxID=989 RepID=A0A2T0XFR7_9BACT|nr:TRAP transporter small permease [Marinilabilia salmonicolor]PRY97798.1 TRAP-type C4-dicarboxylate transport system permease small subunit [Marinilabilia salmonicolor]RCW32497.1 TRAP-type C4-dicarboxylate transport system permease small subunit [Marinilabilia salmonicolor]